MLAEKVFRALDSRFWLGWLVAFILVIVARLPYLLSDHLYFDSDEALLGIMGRDLISGNRIPFYFYGQRYGFSLFEAAAAGLFIAFFGSTVWSLKLGGMLLFSLGIERLLKAVRSFKPNLTTYLLVTALLVTFPTWVVWGTKLRGGYITAFVCLAAFIELNIVHSDWERKHWIKAAILLALTCVSQILIAVPIALLYGFRLIRESEHRWIGIGVFILSFLGLRGLAFLNSDYWNPPLRDGYDLEVFSKHIVDGLIPNFVGSFSYGDIYAVPASVSVGSWIFLILVVCSITYGLLKSTGAERTTLALILFGSLSTVLIMPVFKFDSGRYLIPAFTGLMICGLVLNRPLMQLSSGIKTGVLVLALFTLIPFNTNFDKFTGFWLEPQLNDMQVLNELCDTLRERNLTSGFVSDWQLIFILNYLGNEEFAFRYTSGTERINRYLISVNDCYLNSGCSTVLVGGHWPLLNMEKVEGWNERIERINDRFYIMEKPDIKFLEKGGFELPER